LVSVGTNTLAETVCAGPLRRYAEHAAYRVYVGLAAALNKPAAAYRYVTPYVDRTLFPLMALIRSHVDPCLDTPAQDARQ
jgi:hypothetical protein